MSEFPSTNRTKRLLLADVSLRSQPSFGSVSKSRANPNRPHRCRVCECCKMAFHGDFTPVLAKHTKNLSLVDNRAPFGDWGQHRFPWVGFLSS